MSDTATTTKTAELTRRGVVAISGPDAEKLLNDLVTADIAAAGAGRAVYAALLTPQGKVLFDFLVFRDGERFLFDLPRAKIADFVKRITFYRLRANIDIAEAPEMRVFASWGDAPHLAGIAAPDPRLPQMGLRALASEPTTPNAGETDYDAHRIALGVPEGGIDFAYGEHFPHDLDMDQLTGIDFKKGCYVGQEVVSRMEHRGTARRRFVIAESASPLPSPGTEIAAEGKPLGTLGTSAGGKALALVRLDRAREAMDKRVMIAVSGVPLTLQLPPWARFGWPTAAAGD